MMYFMTTRENNISVSIMVIIALLAVILLPVTPLSVTPAYAADPAGTIVIQTPVGVYEHAAPVTSSSSEVILTGGTGNTGGGAWCYSINSNAVTEELKTSLGLEHVGGTLFNRSSNNPAIANIKFQPLSSRNLIGRYHVYFLNINTGTGLDTKLRFHYSSSSSGGEVQLGGTFSHGDKPTFTWHQITTTPIAFTGTGSEYIKVSKGDVSTSDSIAITRAAAVKFVPFSAANNDVTIFSMTVKNEDESEINLGGIRDDKNVYNAYIPITDNTATLNLHMENPNTAVTVGGEPYTLGTNLDITDIPEYGTKSVAIAITSADETVTRNITLNIERAFVIDNADERYNDSSADTPGSVAIDHLDSNLAGSTRYSNADGGFATWTLQAGDLAAGDYNVYIWKPINIDSQYDTSDTTQVEVKTNNNEVDTRVVNMQGGTTPVSDWMPLGKHTFAGTGTEYVKAYKPTGKLLRMDAVKFVPAAPVAENDITFANSSFSYIEHNDVDSETKTVPLDIRENIDSYNFTHSTGKEIQNASSITFKLQPTNPDATVTVNETPVPNDDWELEIPINKETRTFAITILSEDNSATKTYNVTISNYLVLDYDVKGYSETGTWNTIRNGYKSKGARATSDEAEATATWTFAPRDIAELGVYSVETLCVLLPTDTKYPATFTVGYFGGNSADVSYDFRTGVGAGSWAKLGGGYVFDETTAGSITVTKPENGVQMYVDAVRIIRIPSDQKLMLSNVELYKGADLCDDSIEESGDDYKVKFNAVNLKRTDAVPVYVIVAEYVNSGSGLEFSSVKMIDECSVLADDKGAKRETTTFAVDHTRSYKVMIIDSLDNLIPLIGSKGYNLP